MASTRDDMILNAIFNPHNPLEVAMDTESDVILPETYNVSGEMKLREIEAVNLAQKGEYDGSLFQLNDLIEKCPKYPSLYNNRAQLYRLTGNKELALTDLNKAIELSEGKGKAASQAYTQRAILLLENKDEASATEDFKKASCLGNQFAKAQLTALNPYAALCNQMLSEVFQRIYDGKPDL